MLLFRYFKSHGYETLRDGQLKASAPSSFNDPFEFLPKFPTSLPIAEAKRLLKAREKSDDWYQKTKRTNPAISNKKIFKEWMRGNREVNAKTLRENHTRLMRDVLESRLQIMDRKQRIVCFSQEARHPWEEILLWSHYADSHRGVRIGFNMPAALPPPMVLAPMRYQEARCSASFQEITDPNSNSKWAIEAMMVKSKGWEYEREVRLFNRPEDCNRVKESSGAIGYYVRFDASWVTTVDLGMRFPESKIPEIFELVKQKYPLAILRKGRFHDQTFAVEYTPAV